MKYAIVTAKVQVFHNIYLEMKVDHFLSIWKEVFCLNCTNEATLVSSRQTYYSYRRRC
jgi:hypothetical protein